jgi:hypothetical protein
VTVTPLSITSCLYPTRPALMSRLNQPPFVGGPLRPCILKQAELENAALQTGGQCDPRQQFSNASRPTCRAVACPCPRQQLSNASRQTCRSPAGPNLRLQRFKRAARLVRSSNSAMPVDQTVEQLPAPSDSSFSSPVKPVRE